MAKVIIFGVLDTAELAHFYLPHDSEHKVVAFCLTKEYIKENIFKGLPVVPFEEVQKLYPPEEHKFFAPMTGRKMNRLRESVYYQIKEKGYGLISYVSSKATVFPGVEIGDNCFILEDNTIQPFASIGNNVVLWSGNHFGVNATIRDYSHIAEGTFVAMGANVTKNTEPYGVYMGNPAKKGPKPSTEVYK